MNGYGSHGAMPPFYFPSPRNEMNRNTNQIFGGIELQAPLPNLVIMNQEILQEGKPQAFQPQPQWCALCGKAQA